MIEGFEKFGKINKVTLKDTYAFVDFETHEAAVEAVKEMDGKKFFNDEILKVEQSRT